MHCHRNSHQLGSDRAQTGVMARAKRIVFKLAGSAESALMQINLLRNHQRFPRLI